MNKLVTTLDELLEKANVPSRRPPEGSWVKFIEKRFDKLSAYLKLQIWSGIIIIKFASGCFTDTDDLICHNGLLDFVYDIRQMDVSNAIDTWQKLLTLKI